MHLANQLYTVCVRQERGHCSISYTEAGSGAWRLGGQSPAPASLTSGAYLGDSCQEDWVGIPGAGDTAGAANNYDRFCGDRLNLDATSPSPATIYTQVTPYRSNEEISAEYLALNDICRLLVNFDSTELDSPATPSAEFSKGFSIYYSQISC